MTAKKEFPLITICVPTYNRKDYLRICLDSLAGQSYPNCEIIVVDDGSNDGTREMVFEEFPQVKYIYQENAGTAAAKNHAIQQASGEYIVFNDSDDVFLPGAVEELFKALPEDGKTSCSYGTYITINADGIRQNTKRKVSSLPSGVITGDLLEHIIVTNCGTLIPKKLFLELGGFDRTLRVAEDYKLFLNLSRKAEFFAVQEPIYLRRRHGSNLSSANYTKSKTVFSVFDDFVRKNPDVSRQYSRTIRRRYADLHNKLYREAKREGMKKEAFEHAKAAFKYHPDPKFLFRLFFVFFSSMVQVKKK